jgi:glycine dehydrogenase
MLEPTESESLNELQKFVDAMEKIKGEIYTIPEILKNAPHTQSEVCGEWNHGYTREEAVFPNRPKNKFWPAVSRIDNVSGDRNLVCSCAVEIGNP